jgi:hypothetical protein
MVFVGDDWADDHDDVEFVDVVLGTGWRGRGCPKDWRHHPVACCS